MKKFFIYSLSIIAVLFCSLAVCFGSGFLRVKADTVEKVKVETFLPSSALELYDLTSPLSVCYSESGYLVITEHVKNDDGTSLFDRISVYDPTSQKYVQIPEHQTIYNVTHASEWNGYIFYLSSSKLYSLTTSDLSAPPIDTGVTSSNFFHIKGEFLLTNTNNTIEIYKIAVENSNLTFTKTSTLNFTTKNAFISNENDIYYLFGGKLYCYETASSTSYAVCDVLVDVNYMAELGGYVYLTSSSGVYKVSKGKNKTLELIRSTSATASGLGELASPQGISAYNGELLIADSTLKSIQGLSVTGEFTTFAITTESTADYRLTAKADKISLSENFIYTLDDGNQNGNGVTYKRIVKTALSPESENRHQSISLESLYVGEEGLDVKYFACSDNLVAIYLGKTISLYNIESGDLKLVYQIESESVTSLFYLDGEFYYTDYALLNFGYNAVNIKKITIPTEENGETEFKVTKLNGDNEIEGVALNACVDVFGNFYIVIGASVDSPAEKIIKYSNGDITTLVETDKKFISFKTDFAGNLYGLYDGGVIYKYSTQNGVTTLKTYSLDTEIVIIDIDLNYRSNVCYALSTACILNTADDTLEIANLSEVGKANGLSTILSSVDGKFITADKNAKLFKVSLGDYDQNGNFKSITPVTNPYPNKEFLIVDEIDNYYLISCQEKFVALVRKTDTIFSQDKKFITAIISESDYSLFDIKVNNKQGSYIISNDTSVYSKPLFASAYKISTLEKGSIVYAIKEVEFNGSSLTLISDSENGEPIGYVITGYLNGETQTLVTTKTETSNVVGGDGKRHFNTVLMILIIAFTVTATALFIEKKLIFDKEDGNKN
ncbi:MAG: hypothetical protein IKJ14_02590 [Clostridia bacterium]|nr:hypothetical protein [Clostridia bacterium]